MKKLCIPALVAVAALQLPLASVHAKETPSNAVVVTATRLDEDTTKLPALVKVITSEQIQKSPAQSIPELLALEAGITTRSFYGNYAARASVDLRGFGAADMQNTLILLDGRRLNDVDLSGVDFAAIPLAAIERIEVIHGGGGVLYGDGAVGGTINIITRQPGRAGTRGHAKGTIASYDTRKIDASADHAMGPVSLHAYVNGVRSDGYRRNNDLEQKNLLTDLRVDGDRTSGFVKIGITDQELRLPGARRVDPAAGVDELETDRRGTSTPNDFAQQSGYSVAGGVTRFLSGDAELILDGGYRTKNQKSFFDDYAFGGAFASYADSDLSSRSFTPRLKNRYTLFGAPATLQTGVDYYRSYYDSDRALNESTISTPIHRLAIRQTSTAAYLHNTSEFESTSLQLGARVQRVKLNARDTHDPGAPGAGFDNEAAPLAQRDTEHSLEIGARHRLDSNWSVFERFARAARFATVDELFEFDPTTFARVFSPLEPQTSRGIDVGADYRANELTVSISGYWMKLENEIHFSPATFTNENLDPTRRLGLTIASTYQASKALRLKGDAAYTRAEFREGAFAGNDVPLVPRYSGALSLLWDIRATTTLTATSRYVGSKRFDNDQSNTFQTIPDYWVTDLKLGTRFGAWRLEAAVNNVFDEKAFDYGVRSAFSPGVYNAYPLPERNFTLSVSGEF